MISKALIAASTKPILLAFLSEGEDYGYSIIQRVKQLSGGKLDWADGMLYPVLHRMEKEGIVAVRWAVSEGGRLRKYYRITDLGREELHSEMAQWRLVVETLRRLWKPLLDLA